MPYIPKEERDRIEQVSDIKTPGQLNFYITEALNSYVKERGITYRCINDVLGALEGAKLEFYRRVAVPYENTKMVINGDVYDI